MRLPCNRGSVGVPDLQLYYEAAQLANVLRMLSTDEMPDWMLMGLNNPLELLVREIFWMAKKERPKTIMSNPYSETTLKIWDK